MCAPAGLEAEEGAAGGGLRRVHGVPRAAAGQARVVDLGDQRVRGQPARNRVRAGGRTLHAQRHRFQPAQRQPAVEGAQAAALRVLGLCSKGQGGSAQGQQDAAAEELIRKHHSWDQVSLAAQ